MSESSFILLASTSTGEDRSLSPVKRAKVAFISAVELHIVNTDSLCNCSYHDPKIVHQTVNLFIYLSHFYIESNILIKLLNVMLTCRIKTHHLHFMLEFRIMYVHLDRREVRISSPPGLPG